MNISSLIIEQNLLLFPIDGQDGRKNANYLFVAIKILVVKTH